MGRTVQKEQVWMPRLEEAGEGAEKRREEMGECRGG